MEAMADQVLGHLRGRYIVGAAAVHDDGVVLVQRSQFGYGSPPL
jgi:hypothetical protein